MPESRPPTVGEALAELEEEIEAIEARQKALKGTTAPAIYAEWQETPRRLRLALDLARKGAEAMERERWCAGWVYQGYRRDEHVWGETIHATADQAERAGEDAGITRSLRARPVYVLTQDDVEPEEGDE